MRQAMPHEGPAIESWLSQFPATTMFLRSNLAHMGLGQSEHANSTDFWIAEKAAGEIVGVLGVTKAGWVMAQFAQETPLDIDAIRAVLTRYPLCGFNGDMQIMQPLIEGLGIDRNAFQILDDDVLYTLDLKDLRLPDLEGAEVRQAQEHDFDQLVRWREAFEIEALSTPKEMARGRAERSARRLLDQGWSYVLQASGRGVAQDVAMAGFNAKIADLVQIGGVYTPPTLRGKGYGGAVVGQMLDMARRDGVGQAILFAATAEAGRVYERLGFKAIGHYTLSVLKDAKGQG
ncbi:MAG: GNAT family N-acetyltransferase [Pseudomonadota bacterium]